MKNKNWAKEHKTELNLGSIGTWLLTIAFVVLKALGYINWSWVWVFAPLWIGFSVGLIILIAVVIATVVIESKINKW